MVTLVGSLGTKLIIALIHATGASELCHTGVPERVMRSWGKNDTFHYKDFICHYEMLQVINSM